MDDGTRPIRLRKAMEESDFVLVNSILSEGGKEISREESYIWIRALYMLGMYEECIKRSEEAISKNGNDWLPAVFNARSLSSMGRKENSVTQYEKMISEFPEKGEPYIVLIRHYFKDKQFEIALGYTNSLLEIISNSQEGLLFRARILREISGAEESLEAYKLLHEEFPENLEACGRIGQICFEKEEYEQAREFLLYALEIDEEYRPARRLIGLCLERLGESSDALGYLLSEAEREPDIVSNWMKIINIHLKLNNEVRARETIQLASSITPNKIDALTTSYALSRSIFWKEGMDDSFSELMVKFEQDFRAHKRMFETAIEFGDCTLALSSLKGMKNATENCDQKELSKKNVEFERILEITGSSEDEISGSKEDVLISELAIKKIIKISRKERFRRPSIGKHRVAHVSSSLGRGGAERQLSIGLAGLKKAKNISSISLFTYKHPNEEVTYAPEIRNEGIEIIHYGTSLGWKEEFSSKSLGDFSDLISLLPPRFQRDLIPLSRAFIKYKPTIVHTWQDETNIIAGLAALIARVPVVVMFGRSMRPDEKTMLHIRNRQYLRGAYTALLEDKRFTLCLNSVQGMKSYQEWLDFEDGELRVVFNGIDLESIINNENEQEVEEFLSIKNINGKKIVGGIFRFVKEKRLELWIDSAKKTIDERDDVVFIAVGDGNEREKAIALVEGTRYEEKILFPGSTNAVSSWLKKFDLFILTSVVEGLPNVLIEAQSFGVPVLSTRAGGAEDTFINLGSGVLLTDEEPEQIANSISLCLDDFSWRKRASKSGEEFAMKSFSKESMVETICQLYDDVSIHYRKRWQKDANIITKMLAAVGRD